MTKQITVLASGDGSNFQALIDAGLPVSHVVCDKTDAHIIERADQNGIFWSLIQKSPDKTLEEWGDDIIDIVGDPDLIVCAGFMRILPKNVCDVYTNKIINIHPSLLPAYKGSINALHDAYQHGDLTYGITVHHVTEEVDAGPIIAQESFTVEYGTLFSKIQKQAKELEHKLIVEVVKDLIK